LNIEITNATEVAIHEVNRRGGSVEIVHTARKALQYMYKPYKFEFPIATPQPSPHEVLALEKMRMMGANIKYPDTLWLNEYLNNISIFTDERDKRIASPA